MLTPCSQSWHRHPAVTATSQGSAELVENKKIREFALRAVTRKAHRHRAQDRGPQAGLRRISSKVQHCLIDLALLAEYPVWLQTVGDVLQRTVESWTDGMPRESLKLIPKTEAPERINR